MQVRITAAIPLGLELSSIKDVDVWLMHAFAL